MVDTDRSGPRGQWVVLVVLVLAGSVVSYSFALGVGAGTDNLKVRQLQALISSLQSQNSDLQRQLSSTSPPTNTSLLGLDPVHIYASASPSIVTVAGQADSGNGTVLGSGFVTLFQGSDYVVTNYHVVHAVHDISVTFQDGNSYPGALIGADPYVDLAVLSFTAPSSELHPLAIIGSSQLRVGEPVVAIGNPFGLSGSMTFGIISQTGRTLSESLAGDFAIADVIQFSAPINPGNSGGPLLNANGSVVGITTASVISSQGVGFAIPAAAIIRELPSLVTTGGYSLHSFMGIRGVDMSLQFARLQGTNVTYGLLVQNVTAGGPAYVAGLRGGTHTALVQGAFYSIGGDIIVAINGTRIVNVDALSSYLQERTIPGQTLALQIIRGGNLLSLSLILGTRPPPPPSA